MSDLIQIAKKDTFPVLFTESALKRVLAVIAEDEELDDTFAVRVSCKGGGCSGILFNLDFDNQASDSDFVKDFSFNDQKVTVVIDSHSAPYLEGVTVNYVQTGLVGGFKFEGGDKVKKTCGCGKSFAV